MSVIYSILVEDEGLTKDQYEKLYVVPQEINGLSSDMMAETVTSKYIPTLRINTFK